MVGFGQDDGLWLDAVGWYPTSQSRDLGALKTIPQRLKPHSFFGAYGTAKAVPFQNIEFFRKL